MPRTPQTAKPHPKTPNPVDKHIGSRVRMRRMMMGMSQEKLGDALDLTFQQVQKYEKGVNRIGGSRMQQLSHILQVPVSFFYEGLEQPVLGKSEAAYTYVNDFNTSSIGITIMESFARIKDDKIKRRIADLIEQIAVM